MTGNKDMNDMQQSSQIKLEAGMLRFMVLTCNPQMHH